MPKKKRSSPRRGTATGHARPKTTAGKKARIVGKLGAAAAGIGDKAFAGFAMESTKPGGGSDRGVAAEKLVFELTQKTRKATRKARKALMSRSGKRKK